ncbi:MAG: heme ABC transporter ATP-binding protein [Verrucomicrobiota bacterium]
MILKADNIAVAFGKKKILDKVDAWVESGQVLAILGPNGAGKSTLFRVLTGELAPSAGKVFLDDQELSSFSRRELSLRRAAMNQQVHIPFPISAKEVVMLGRAPFFGWQETQRDHQVVDHALELVEMSEFANRDYPSLSGGEKQRIQLARALVQLEGEDGDLQNKFLLLDEPSSALDLKHRHDVLNMCQGVAKRGAAVFLIIHDINMALTYADQTLVLSNGTVYAHGNVETILTEELVKDVFEIEARLVKMDEKDRGHFVYHVAQ